MPTGTRNHDAPLLPRLVELLADWCASHDDAGTGRLLTRNGEAVRRDAVAPMLNRAARRAGIGHVHPHQLRHTLATRAVNRGMRLESIAALLGHRSLRMTMVCARIANRTVAEEYHAISTKVEALYAASDLTETPAMRQLRGEFNRMLGNGWCTRPKEMGCSFSRSAKAVGSSPPPSSSSPPSSASGPTRSAKPTDRVALFGGLLSTIDDDDPAAASGGGGR